jgi:hypothetical protein
VSQFGIENAGDFTGKATAEFANVTALVNATESEAAKQQSGFGEAGQQFEIKDTAREDLRDLMSTISRTAKSMEYEFDAIVQNKYADNPGKLAAWISASHVEKAPKKKATPTP